ncbi:TetR/AcrR family transcriptional regulator [Naasia lichenicola]|uniref:TetR/AcrR family transcriptional regulator n=1 Tax=Naasia lichenicola TaxID=2565933 RepID=UPI00130D5854|nr:TetR/AcrR family transcriptional regulator [Naasia lichenicola]
MEDPVKRGRTYDVSGRQERTRLSRQRVLREALRLMSSSGYVATTVPQVAEGAGVSVEFIYKQMGDKAALARQVLEFALVGDDDHLEMRDRPIIQRMIEERDPFQVTMLYADMAGGINARAGAFLVALAAAAPTNPAVEELSKRAAVSRRAGARSFVRDVAGKTELSVPVSSAVDGVWALTSPELHRMLVGERGWSEERYTQWLGETLAHALRLA